jgi:hypothetical protein
MGKTMTDQEFETLKNKIQVAESYTRHLQELYRSQTGVRHHPSGPMPAVLLVETAEIIAEDMQEARGI